VFFHLKYTPPYGCIYTYLIGFFVVVCFHLGNESDDYELKRLLGDLDTPKTPKTPKRHKDDDDDEEEELEISEYDEEGIDKKHFRIEYFDEIVISIKLVLKQFATFFFGKVTK